MNKFLRGLIFVAIFLIPLAFYFFRSSRLGHEVKTAPAVLAVKPAVKVPPEPLAHKPKIAIIFDDLGETLHDVRQLYALDVPLTVAIIPGLKHSSNVAHFAGQCGFSVLVHLPMEPKSARAYQNASYKFITRRMKDKSIKALLRYYLNGVPLAIGVNNHMGSAATRDERVMGLVLDALKEKGYIFIDSRTALDSIAYDLARQRGVTADYNHGFIDAVDDAAVIEKKLDALGQKAAQEGKIIIIGHPRKNTLAALRKKLPALKKQIEFITIKEYFSN
jgi:hypothetical protein